MKAFSLTLFILAICLHNSFGRVKNAYASGADAARESFYEIKLELFKEGPKLEVQSTDEKFLHRLRETILSRLDDPQPSVESLAEDMAFSRSELLRKVTALTGTSVNELIRTLRLQKAAQLLEQNWGTVTQIAYEVGFSNLSYCSKVFKEKFGVLPSDYAVKTSHAVYVLVDGLRYDHNLSSTKYR